MLITQPETIVLGLQISSLGYALPWNRAQRTQQMTSVTSQKPPQSPLSAHTRAVLLNLLQTYLGNRTT